MSTEEDSKPKYTQDQLIEMMRRGAAGEYLEYGASDNPLLLLTIPAAVVPISPEEIWQTCLDNEDGDARLYIRIFRERRVYDHTLAEWFMYDKHAWRRDDIDQVMGDIEEVITCYAAEATRLGAERTKAEEKGASKLAEHLKYRADEIIKRIRQLRSLGRKERVVTLARMGAYSLAVTGKEWDTRPELLACPSGVLDLTTGEIRDGRPGDFIKCVIPTPWDGIDAPCPNWERFLLEVFDQDEDLVDYMHRLLGYAISGRRCEDILPILHGQGRNGKTTMLESIKAVLGPVSGPIQAETLLEQQRPQSGAGPSPDIVDLRGRRLVWASESGDGRRLNESRVKWLTGGDTLKGRPVHGKDMVEFKPTHTLLLLTNHKPHASGDDYALWKRIRLIPFTLSFVDNPEQDFERKADKGLQVRLLKEAPGILAWLVRGCLTWQAKGLGMPESVRAATVEYQGDEDMIGTFLDDCTTRDPHNLEKATDLYKIYRKWGESNGLRVMSSTRFGKAIKKRVECVKNGIMFYKGIRVKEGIGAGD